MNNRTGDFEVLHCLNQIYDIEDIHTEFSRLSPREMAVRSNYVVIYVEDVRAL